MTALELGILVAGCLAGGALVVGLLWSVYRPDQRIWPPATYNATTPMIAWSLVAAVFGSAICMGILGWNTVLIPEWIRWGIGLPFILIGNLVVWRGVYRIGMDATSGAKAELVTNGIYSRSRNPQYLADIMILIGIGLFSAAVWVWPVVGAGVAALFLAPFAEEPWLEAQYEDAFRAYCNTTPRFL